MVLGWPTWGLTLKYADCFIITYDQFKDYLDNARTILTDMNYHQGDRKFPNECNMAIYLNPKYYSVVDFEKLLSFTDV